jgi:protease-4
LQKQVSDFYDIFLSRINKGRNLPISYIDSIGMGRVWTGIDGIKLKLVDSLGNTNDAIKKAAQLAKVSDYRVVTYPAPVTLYQQIMDMMTPETTVNELIPQEFFTSFYYYYLLNKNIENPVILTRLPYDINLE